MNKTDHWTEEECFQLIDMYKNFEILWNPKNINYFRKPNKEDAWQEIASEMHSFLFFFF
jgi:hypothetical protein